MNDTVLLIAARCPVPGETKTRLGRVIGFPESARLYGAFLKDLSDRLVREVRAAGIDVIWTYSPPDGRFVEQMREIGVDIGDDRTLAQSGQTWATRQDTMMRWADAQGYRRILLIASDSPHLPAGHVIGAAEALRSCEVAVGKVEDGGYYLVGMAGYRDVLLDVPMSTERAGDALVANARGIGCEVYAAPVSFDVDEREDLDQLIRYIGPTGEACPATWRVLGELGLVG